MAVIKSGATTDQLTIDPTSKAARVTLYDSSGNYQGKKQTYSASTTAAFAAPAGTTSFFAIAGSSTKTIKIQKIIVTGMDLTTLAFVTVVARKYSTAITLGTKTDLVQVPHDSSNAAGTASIVGVYTAAPTDGSLVGTIATERFVGKSTTVAEGVQEARLEFLFGNGDEIQPVVLRGTAQYLSLAFAAAPATAPNVVVYVTWTEE